MVKLKFLGRGSAFNTKEGNNSAYVKEKDTLILFDCGSNIFDKLRYGNLLNDVKNIYVAITHKHPDHIGSLGDFVFYCYFILGIKVRVLNTECNIREFLLQNGVTYDKTESFDGYIKELDINIIPYKVNHAGIFENENGFADLPTYDKHINLFPCYGFKIIRGNEKIFFSGDCKYLDFSEFKDFNRFYMDTCYLDYPENVHFNVDKLYKACIDNDIDVNKIWCMHIDRDEVIERAKELGFNVVQVEA